MVLHPTNTAWSCGQLAYQSPSTQVRNSSSDETRYNTLVAVEHLYTLNITIEATSIIEMNNSTKQIQRVRF